MVTPRSEMIGSIFSGACFGAAALAGTVFAGTVFAGTVVAGTAFTGRDLAIAASLAGPTRRVTAGTRNGIADDSRRAAGVSPGDRWGHPVALPGRPEGVIGMFST